MIEHDWTLNPRVILSSRLGVDRAYGPGKTNYPDPTKLGFPSILDQANGITRMPAIDMDTPWTPLFTQCCVDTSFAHTLYNYSSSLSWHSQRPL